MTAPTLPRVPVLPPTARPNPPTIPALPGAAAANRSRVRAQWLVLAAALTVLAGTLVAWSLSRAAARVEVVSVARPVPAGAVIESADLTTSAIAFDGEVSGLVPAASSGQLVGRTATIALAPGTLLALGMWADGNELGADERTVGALLAPGRYPTGVEPGTRALAVAVAPAGSAPTATVEPMVVRIVDSVVDEQGNLRVTIAATDPDAVTIAGLAASGNLVLVGLPATDPASAGTP
jgi:hypothetical protein